MKVRARTFGLLLLALVGILPLAVFGFKAVERSEQTALAEVRAGNLRLASSIADRIAAYGHAEGVLLAAIGAAALGPGVTDPQAVLDQYQLDFGHLHDLSVYRPDGAQVTAALAQTGPGFAEAAARALAGESFVSAVSAAGRGRLAHTVIHAEPVVVVGAPAGAVVARVDLVDVWEPVNSVRVGHSGFVRLVTGDGTLLAHGNPEERRHVFAPDRDRDARIAAAGLAGQTVVNQQGEAVVATTAKVPGRDWLVVVEQPVAEAYAAAQAMRRDLYVLGAAAVLLVVLAGILFGRTAVRSLEKLRAHTRTLAAGDLDARIDERAPLEEAAALARALNEMAASLKKLHDEARNRERLSTFARVAAGLAHDIRNPIEAVQSAVGAMVARPDDEGTLDMLRWAADTELPKLRRYMTDLQRLARDGDVKLDVAEVAPRALIDQVVAELAGNRKFGGVEFIADGAADDVVLDAGLVRRAVYNLGTNAADACSSRGRGGRVWIETEQRNGAVLFRVRDTGPGMPADHLARLLDGDFNSTKRTTGVGLGFGVARHVAQAHGGRIDGESVVGQGSTFTIVVPRASPRGDGPGAPAAREPRP